MKSQARKDAQQRAFRDLGAVFGPHVDAMKEAVMADPDKKMEASEALLGDVVQVLSRLLWPTLEFCMEPDAPREVLIAEGVELVQAALCEAAAAVATGGQLQ